MFTLSIISICVVTIQLIYIFLFLIAFGKKKAGLGGKKMPVSIIVCAHDEEANLRKLLPLLLQQNYPQFEVIIVEDRSNDGTYDYLLEAAKKYSLLKMVRVVNKPDHINEKKFALTLGIKGAQYDWVLLTDADCRPASKEWVQQMTDAIQNSTKLVLGFSPYMKTKGLLNAFIRFESFLTGIQMIGFALLGRPYMGVGRNLLYHKSLFLENKGFNNHLGITGGDDDLFVNEHATSKNTCVSMGHKSLTFSIPKLTWGEFYYQKRRHLSVGKYYKLSDKLIVGIFILTWIANYFLVIPMAIVSPFSDWILSLVGIRLILLMYLLYRVSRKFGAPFEAWMVPVLDFVYVFYYLVVGTAAILAKQIEWKRN